MKIVSTTLMIACLFLWASSPWAQSSRSLLYDEVPSPLIPEGHGREDLSAQPAPAEDYGGPALAGAKSPRKAFLFSLLVPGAGEAYAGAVKRGLGFFCVELLSIGVYVMWDGKGDDLETEFRAFADEIVGGGPRWDRDVYEAWRNDAFTYGDTTHTLPFKNREEMEEYQKQFPGRYANAEIDAQQFYELIGKYHQFVFGWNDRSSDNFADTTYTVASEDRDWYEDKRAESNRYLKRAKYALGVILFNHAISAIDASRQARVHNEQAVVEPRTRVRMVLREERGEPVPMLMAWRRF